jgi:hypothetical protein
MRKMDLRKIVVAAVIFVATWQVNAAFISGELQFQGHVVLDGPVGEADQIISYSGPGPNGKPTVLGGSTSGDYASVLGGTEVTWSPFVFNPADASVSPLWSFTFNGLNYWFNATSVSVVTQNDTFLNIVGNGVAYIDGFEATAGSWQLTVTGGTANFAFGAYSSAAGSVPDTGMAAGMLLTSLSGLWFLRRKLSV